LFTGYAEGCLIGTTTSTTTLPTTTTTTTLPTTTTTPITTTTESTTPESTTTTQRLTPPPNICDGVELRFVPDPNYCFRFYFCAFGAPSPYECAPNTIFDEGAQGCIDGDWDTCEPLTTTEATTPRPPHPCDGNNFRFIPDPEHCYRFFYCMFGNPLPGECAPGKIFNEQFRGCVDGDRDAC